MMYLVLITTLLGMFLSYTRNKLTLPASISGGIIAMLVYFCAGITGFCMMATFFIMAILATAYKKTEKKRAANDHPEKRNVRQVWANGGIAGLAGALSFFIEDKFIFPLMIACVFSSAAADTISSELGLVKGKTFINILTFQPDRKGLDGVISIEGCLWGLAASILIAGIYYLGFGSLSHFFIIILAGTIGNLSDSLMGAVWERKGWIGNDAVNLMNTIIAAMAGWVLYLIF
jgi:uncharacterized protein (TIGR00297 family)